DGLQHVAPVQWAFLILRIGLRHASIATGLLHPEFQLRLVGVQTDRSRSVRTADALLADLQPVFARQLLGTDQTQGGAGLAGAAIQWSSFHHVSPAGIKSPSQHKADRAFMVVGGWLIMDMPLTYPV